MKEINDLYIKWDDGSMVIHMDEFFPCTEKRLKDLVTKVININLLTWERYNRAIETLKIYFQKRIPECEGEYKSYSKLYFEYMQKKADAEHRIKDKTHPNGVPLTKDELKEFREQRKNSRERAAENLRLAKQQQKNKEQFEKHLVYLETIQRW